MGFDVIELQVEKPGDWDPGRASEVVDALDSDALGLLLDTYHMNIEEKSPADAIRLAGERLVHVHASASDRGTPGADHLDWPAIAESLRAVEYDGPLCIESFTSEN